MKRIALFFNKTYIDAHSCFTELAKHLSASGYEVDLYFILNSYNPPPAFYDPKIRFLIFPRSRFELADFWYKLYFAKDRKYCAVIGTPFEGTFLAYSVSKTFNIPLIYLADEVFNTNLERHAVPNYEKLKLRDIKVNQHAAATIALGQERYTYQKEINKLSVDHKHFVIPNAPAGQSVKLKSNYFRDVFNITDQKPIVLFIGTLGWNLAKELFELAKQFKDKPYHVIFHSRTLGQMGNEEHPFIKISHKPVPSEMLNYVVSSADIGLVLYDKNNKAEKENALTGGKIGTYLKNNLPLLVGNVEEFRPFEKKGLGIFLEDVNQFDSAVQKMMNGDKVIFQQSIEKTYAMEYDYTLFYKKFELFLNTVA